MIHLTYSVRQADNTIPDVRGIVAIAAELTRSWSHDDLEPGVVQNLRLKGDVRLRAVMDNLGQRFGIYLIAPDHEADAIQTAPTLSAKAWVDAFAKRYDLEPVFGQEGWDGVIRLDFARD